VCFLPIRNTPSSFGAFYSYLRDDNIQAFRSDLDIELADGN